ncbi:kinase-like protein [Aspergillus sclerotioniger CBS 115572]|uniref:Kinase-like protein n=1 Tax=Aspergillus sclerotioniger CBS 115572 TaxID=1450535 RepID=A0A317X4G4_9EURO|nr:kinase-like protein [Aspergillus sclerotioniger CBS 115572]PWY93081.1 kinase-like protein [Aspergillus sclerotioniger CBS 115572]
MKLNAQIHPDGSTSQYAFHPAYGQGTAGRWPKTETWKRGKILGSGSFGVVWVEQCVRSQGPARLRAVKMIKKEHDPSKQVYCDQELEAVAKFSQPKYSHLFVTSFGWFENSEAIFITMEHIDLRDLQRHLKGPIPEPEVQQICFQLLQGIQCLHDNRFVYRDLKPQVGRGPRWHVKIGDFGISKRYNESGALQTKAGTNLYLAPEVLRMYPPDRKPHPYTNRVDIWSLGVMLFYLLSCHYPFPNNKSLSSYVRNAHFPSLSLLQSVTHEGQNFVKHLLAVDATVRLSAKEALAEEWLRQPASPVSGISRLAVSEKLTPAVSNLTDSTYKASRGWDNEDASSAMIDELTIRAVKGPQSRSSARRKSTSVKQASRSGPLDNSNTPHNKGLSLLNQKQYGEAERMFRQAFEMRKHALGTNHEDTLASLSSLCDALFDQEKYAEAEEVYQDVWVRRKRVLGESHPDTLKTLYNLGNIVYGKEEFAKAEGMYRIAWEGQRRVLGEYCEDTLDSLDALGDALSGQDKYVEAEEVYRNAWEGRRRVFGEYSKPTLQSLSDLGDAISYQERYVEAEAVHRQAWEGWKQVFGEGCSKTLTSLDSLAEALWLQGKLTEAEKIYRTVCKKRKAVLGTHNMTALWTLVALGQVLQSQEKYNVAESVYRQAWRGLKEAFGANDESTLTSLLKLAQAIEGQENYPKAEAVYREVWEGRKELHGANHEDTFQSLECIIFCLFQQDSYANAERLQRQLYESRREVLGSRHEDTLTSLHALGLFLEFQGKYTEAETAFREAWKGRSENLGANHKDTQESLRCLRDTLHETSPLPKSTDKSKGKSKRSLWKRLSSFWG